jgi:hypothetical protein
MLALASAVIFAAVRIGVHVINIYNFPDSEPITVM